MIDIRFQIRITILTGVLFILSSVLVFAEEKRDDWTNFSQASRLFFENGSQDKIISLCKDIRKSTKDPVLFCRASFLLAESYVRQEKNEDAHKVFQNIYKSKLPISLNLIAETKLRDGQLFLHENSINQAIAIFTSVAKNDSCMFFQHEARFALAWHAGNQGLWDICDSLLQNFAATNLICENDPRIKTLKARKAIAQGDPETAIDLLKENPDKTGLKYLARAYELTGKQIMAVSIYKKIHDSFPNSTESEDALFQVVQVFMRAGDWLAALSELNRLMLYFPNSKYTDTAHFQLGWIYLNLDEIEEALSEFRFNCAPQYSNYFRYMEAECLRKIGIYFPEKLQ